MSEEGGFEEIISGIVDRTPLISGVHIEPIYPDGGCMGMWLTTPVPQASAVKRFVNAAHGFTETMRVLSAALGVIAPRWVSIHSAESKADDITRAVFALDSSVDRCVIAWTWVQHAIDAGEDAEDYITQFISDYEDTRIRYDRVLVLMRRKI